MVKQSQQERGFTIVELLIVIVVIGILAAITIVAYSGITSRANNTKIQANAANVQKVAESFNASFGRYPATLAELRAGQPTGETGSTTVPVGIDLVAGQTGANGTTFTSPTTNPLPTTSDGRQKTVAYSCFITCTNSTGGRIYYWDFVTNAQSTTVIYVGAASATGGAYTTPAAS